MSVRSERNRASPPGPDRRSPLPITAEPSTEVNLLLERQRQIETNRRNALASTGPNATAGTKHPRAMPCVTVSRPGNISLPAERRNGSNCWRHSRTLAPVALEKRQIFKIATYLCGSIAVPAAMLGDCRQPTRLLFWGKQSAPKNLLHY